MQIFDPRPANFMEAWLGEYFDDTTAKIVGKRRLGFGDRPALVVIDLQRNAFEGAGEGLHVRALRNTALLIPEARNRHIPILYTATIYRPDFRDMPPNKLMTVRGKGNIPMSGGEDIVEDVQPSPDDMVLLKQTDSPFLSSSIAMCLNLLRVDSLILTGCHTGGCVRATAIDSWNRGFKTIIIEECVGDRKGINPHKANLCDMHIRGADVISVEELLAHLSSSK